MLLWRKGVAPSRYALSGEVVFPRGQDRISSFPLEARSPSPCVTGMSHKEVIFLILARGSSPFLYHPVRPEGGI